MPLKVKPSGAGGGSGGGGNAGRARTVGTGGGGGYTYDDVGTPDTGGELSINVSHGASVGGGGQQRWW